jgi:hypothetical protein
MFSLPKVLQNGLCTLPLSGRKENHSISHGIDLLQMHTWIAGKEEEGGSKRQITPTNHVTVTG